MEWWTEIRRKVLVEGVSKRRVLRQYGIHCEMLEKILGHRSPPGYRMKEERPKPEIGAHLARMRTDRVRVAALAEPPVLPRLRSEARALKYVKEPLGRSLMSERLPSLS